MQSLRDYLASQSLDAHATTIEGTLIQELAYQTGSDATGGRDIYGLRPVKVALVHAGRSFEIADEAALDLAGELLISSDKVMFGRLEVDRGENVRVYESTVSINAGRALDMWEAQEELSNLVGDGEEDKFQDARWRVFCLTEVFEENPCSRETFDQLSQQKAEAGDGRRFRDYYSEWLHTQANGPGY